MKTLSEQEYRLEQSERLNKVNRIGAPFAVVFITYLMLFSDPASFPDMYRVMIPGRLIAVVIGTIAAILSFLPGMRKHGIIVAFLVFLAANLQMAHLTGVMNNDSSDIIAWLFVSIFFCGIYPLPIGYAAIVVILGDVYYLTTFFLSGFEPTLTLRMVVININTASFVPLAFKVGIERVRKREFTFRKGLEKANREIAALNNKLKDENLRLSHELQVAQHIQSIVLPDETEYRAFNDLDIACRMIPATEVGGDYYDTITFGDGGIIAIGDVTDHGLHSGLIMMMVHTALRTLSHIEKNDIRKVFDVVNKVLYNFRLKTSDHRIMSLILLRYFEEGRFSLTGQHESILLYHSPRNMEEISTLDSGMYAGLEESAEEYLQTIDFELEREEVLVLYTDGVTEAMNEAEVQFGTEGITGAIAPVFASTSEEIMQAIINACQSHMGETRMYDDISIMVLKRR